MVARLLALAARATFYLATSVFLLALALVALSILLATWPYRRLEGPHRRAAKAAATRELVLALARAAMLFRGTTSAD